MWPKRDVHALALVAAVAAVCTACKNPSRTDGRAAKAREVVQSADMRVRTIDETNDYVVIVRREQLALRARLHERIAEIDTALAGLRVAPHEPRRAVARGRVDGETTEAKRIETLVRSREVLKADLVTLELADERGWEEIKAGIERDLEVHAPRGSI